MKKQVENKLVGSTIEEKRQHPCDFDQENN
jgi:hypothetical protein